MVSNQRTQLALISLWLALVLVSLFARSLFPIDETRYVTVAWNMWLRGDYLVPYLNNIPYSHKPPLLFWLMNLGWAVFGVNDWWPRLIPSLFALGCILLTGNLAARLWPQQRQVGELAPLLLLGCALWVLFTTAIMFDLMVAFFTLLGVLGIVIAWQENGIKGWIILGLAIGGGLLSKGPTILLQTLPLAVLAPWWGQGERRRWGAWYGGIGLALLLGVLIGLAWAIPATQRGGETYQHAIFWGQTAERMVNSFAHRKPVWWYLPLLPVMFFPWLLWLPVWRGFNQLRKAPDLGVRFCLAWSVPVLLAFSFISGKQMHYLLPIFPAVVLLMARGLPQQASRYSQLPAALALIGLGAALLYLPYHAQQNNLAVWIAQIPAWDGALVLGLGLLVLLLHYKETHIQAWKLTAITIVAVLYIHNAVMIHRAGLAYDMRPMAAKLKALEDANIPVAHLGKYPGQYQFVGRLTREPDIVTSDQLKAWFDTHPNGKVIAYLNSEDTQYQHADYSQPYKGDFVYILGRAAWEANTQAVPDDPSKNDSE